MTVGLLQGILEAIGEADNEAGGLYQTRLTAAVGPLTALTPTYTWNGTLTVTTADTSDVEAGDWITLNTDGTLFEIESVTTNVSVTLVNPVGYPIPTGDTGTSKATRSLPVESALGWADSGKVGVEGMVYRYASRTNTSLDEITFLAGGESVVGLNRRHTVEATVVNLNRELSGLDLVRRALLVNYAEGEDLNALGRNLGVNRLGFVSDDDVFRDIIKALAYNPKGTLLGLKLALNALVGEGNYTIYEDLINFPNKVFILLPGGVLVTAVSQGKFFLSNVEFQNALSTTTVPINNPVHSSGSVEYVRLRDEDWWTECRSAYPSADQRVEYEGGSAVSLYSLSGTGVSEGTHVTLGADYTEFTLAPPTDTCRYYREARIQPESEAEVTVLLTVPTSSPTDAQRAQQIALHDTERTIVAFVRANGASTWEVGFSTITGTLIGTPVQFNRDEYHEVKLKKSGTEDVELWVDGVLARTEPYSSFTASGSPPAFWVGRVATISATVFRIQAIGLYCHTLTDYYAGRGDNGTVLAVNDQRLDGGVPGFFVSGDVGKTVKIYNAANPINNGTFLVDSLVSAQIVELRGAPQPGLIAQSGGNPLRVEIPVNGPQFQYPDDIGKEVIVSGSTLGNDGAYTIATLLQQGTLADLSSGATPVPEKTNVAEFVAASLVPETGLTWKLNPKFVDESGLDWVMSDAGSVTGTVVTLRQGHPLPVGFAYKVLEVSYSIVVSALLLLDISVDGGPVYNAMYLTDPLAFVKEYLDTITAAGVIPDFIVE